MTADDRPQLAKMLAVLGATFNEPVDELKAEGYYFALQDLPLDDVRTAGYAALKTCKFFPRPAELRELIQGNGNDQAELAWAILTQQVRREGYTGKPQLSDATWDVVKALWGSWESLCQTLPGEGPELLGWAKRFRAVYSSPQRIAERLALPLFTEKRGELSA